MPCWDQVLKRSRKQFLRLMRHLLRIGLVSIAPVDSAFERCRLFFLARKPCKGTSPLIIEARRANHPIQLPPGVHLCSGEALARIKLELPQGMFAESPEVQAYLDQLEFALSLSDIKDTFPRLRTPFPLARYFGVGRATTEELRIVGTFMDNERLIGTSELDLLWSSLPMGFTWSLLF